MVVRRESLADLEQVGTTTFNGYISKEPKNAR
jgi:hypothetical protein